MDRDSTKTTSTPVPSAGELRNRLLAQVDEIRRALDQTAVAASLSTAQQAEYQRLRTALESLERRVREILAE
ncbi:MAG: hypothetical protein AUG93_00015 [Armatimonadetes bacterium 13_1_20CM_4_65_7]|uniref:Uncharacterized protein n=1 Tax=Candidatus Segetimicrobium genomatis TaxID=2569760 RepID=A0A537KZ32_9BACT|nr:MAG: hypothetical protein AUG93_00015 [Armatimonadetes bacterium 13_1_20CM_4_65_7]TMJ01012.1 MAG: hypothetical protein E6H01_08365 [Terrabacteria group bacterium ANGP1]